MTVTALCPIPALGVREAAIEGGFRRITTHQLALAWWCHSAGHITRRQLRVWFAAHEMHERRCGMAQEATAARRGGQKARKPLYGLEELKTLVGGRGSPTADAELTADLRHLAKIGLVCIDDHTIRFAVSADQIVLPDISGFWTLFEQIPNTGRTVPVPRRTLRALAGGFSRGVTGVMIALMIRSLFWHRGSADYRVDGRTKGSWISDVFGLSRRTVTDARAHLIDMGWLEPIETSQWELNRWGAHDRIHVQWSPAAPQANEAVGEGGHPVADGGKSASPIAENSAEIASPNLNSSPSPAEKDLKNRKPGREPDPAGVCTEGFQEKESSAIKPVPPRLHDIQPEHLRDTEDLLELYAQAVKRGLAKGSQASQLDFFALAERARARGRNPGGLFKWLLTHQRFDFITQADEDAASWRLREWHYGRAERSSVEDLAWQPAPKPKERVLTDDDKLVRACLKVAEQRKIADAYWIARQIKADWTRERWEAAVKACEAAELDRWQ